MKMAWSRMWLIALNHTVIKVYLYDKITSHHKYTIYDGSLADVISFVIWGLFTGIVLIAANHLSLFESGSTIASSDENHESVLVITFGQDFLKWILFFPPI